MNLLNDGESVLIPGEKILKDFSQTQSKKTSNFFSYSQSCYLQFEFNIYFLCNEKNDYFILTLQVLRKKFQITTFSRINNVLINC